jgi:hypothetical protein
MSRLIEHNAVYRIVMYLEAFYVLAAYVPE